MAFWNRSDQKDIELEDATSHLQDLVHKHLPQADPTTVQIVACVAGLLAAVAYADRTITPEEQAMVRQQLSRVHGLSPEGVQAIARMLGEKAPEVSTLHVHSLTRTLKELADQDTRLEILDMLVDLAAADNTITLSETNYLRQIATSMGLTYEDYNASQQRHREKLSVLK